MMVSSKFFIVLIILLGIGFAYADDESANGSIGQFFRNLPRTNAAKTFNPQDPKYIEGITLLGLPFFILSLISVVFWILIFCCCKPARTVHSSSFLQCSRFLIISLCVLICGFALWGVASNSSIHNHENSLFDPLLTAQGDTMNKIEVLDTYIAAVNVTGNTATQLENVLKEINTTYIQLQSAKNFTEKYEKSREIAIGVLLSYTVVITVVTTFSMMCLYKLGLRLTIFFALLCLPSLMVLTGISLPVTVLVSDGCPNIQTLMTDNSKSSDGAIWINYYITCSGTNPLANVTDYANKKLNQTEYELEQAIKYHDTNAIAQLNKTIGEIKQAIIALDNLSDCSGTKEAWDKTYSTACTTIFDDIAVIFFVSFSLIFLLSVLIGAEFLLYSKSTKFASSSSNGYEPLKNFEE